VSSARSATDGPGQALFQFVRHWSRRWHETDPQGRARQGRDVLVAEAVHALRGSGQVTVNDIAAELGIDQSGASRMIADATARGILAIEPAPHDARRRLVRITPEGITMLAAAHSWQESTFDALTARWTKSERSQFHRAMTRLLDASPRLDMEDRSAAR
jgi:DNA-binding MarR family transcriptional regulator